VGKPWIWGLAFLSLGGVLVLGHPTLLRTEPSPIADVPAQPMSEPEPAPTLQYQTYSLPHAVVHTLRIPAQSGFMVTVAAAPELTYLEDFADHHGALAVLNGGFFDPQNQKTTSHVVQQGQQVADPRDNERLINNPDLTSYMDRILDRSEFRRYNCDGKIRYDIVRHSAPIPASCQLVDSLGAGPQLLPDTAAEEGFVAYDANGAIARDALGSRYRNARTAVGLTPENDVVWVMVAQTAEAPGDSGMSFAELADWMQTLGIEKALNLDGGSSSALYYDQETVYGRVNAEGDRIRRPVKSVLLVQPR
jgi:hypothetical protein